MPARAGWMIVTSTEAQRERKGKAAHEAGGRGATCVTNEQPAHYTTLHKTA